jgi:hypothetical protein
LARAPAHALTENRLGAARRVRSSTRAPHRMRGRSAVRRLRERKRIHSLGDGGV